MSSSSHLLLQSDNFFSTVINSIFGTAGTNQIQQQFPIIRKGINDGIHIHTAFGTPENEIAPKGACCCCPKEPVGSDSHNDEAAKAFRDECQDLGSKCGDSKGHKWVERKKSGEDCKKEHLCDME